MDSFPGFCRVPFLWQSGKRGGKWGKEERTLDTRQRKQLLCLAVNSLGFPALRSFLFAPGEDVGEVFFRDCTLGAAAGHKEKKRL